MKRREKNDFNATFFPSVAQAAGGLSGITMRNVREINNSSGGSHFKGAMQALNMNKNRRIEPDHTHYQNFKQLQAHIAFKKQ